MKIISFAMIERADTLAQDNIDLEIRITICDTDPTETHPLNGDWQWDGAKFQPVGMRIRLWASKYSVNPWFQGREVHSDDPRQYESAAHAIRKTNLAMDALAFSRGPSVDCADSIGRFLEVCRVKTVFMRPQPTSEGWLHRGEWTKLTIGETVALVREKSEVAQKDCANAA
jgi:hypothetical protein